MQKEEGGSKTGLGHLANKYRPLFITIAIFVLRGKSRTCCSKCMYTNDDVMITCNFDLHLTLTSNFNFNI